MNFGPLFLTSQIVTSVYRIVLTIWLLYHLGKRILARESPRNGREAFSGRSHRRGFAVEG